MTSPRPLALLMLSIAAVGIQALMLSPLVPDIASGLNTTAKHVGFAAGAYGIGVALAALIAAPRLGRWPKRLAIASGFAVLAASLVVCGLAFHWQVLVAGQFMVGLASGVIIPSTYALTGDISPPETRAQAMGRVLFGWSISLVIGVPLAAVLSAFVGWRGTFLLVAAAAALMVPGGLMLPRVEGAASSGPVRFWDVLRIPGALLGYFCTFCYMIGFYQTYTFIGDHVRTLHHVGAWLGGAIALSYGVGFGLAVFGDRWIDRTGPRRVMPLGLALVGINYLLLPFAAEWWQVIAVYPFFWGVVNHLAMTAIVAFVNSLSAERRGALMGLFSFTTYASLGTAGAVYGTVYDDHGFFAVSLAAAATLFVAAISAGWPLLQRQSTRGTP
ncbi:MFS transporter [Aestuariivirga sp.]|uniref:MFS transporter n=1 Tax=Aestuariivirga sp. TaxID=2650926 RepID=UPI0039E34634